jgi:hypothetical protein
LAANDAVIFVEVEGNTIADDNVPAKLKHFRAQLAIVAQPSTGFSHGTVLCGQQSMSSIVDMPAGAAD